MIFTVAEWDQSLEHLLNPWLTANRLIPRSCPLSLRKCWTKRQCRTIRQYLIPRQSRPVPLEVARFQPGSSPQFPTNRDWPDRTVLGYQRKEMTQWTTVRLLSITVNVACIAILWPFSFSNAKRLLLAEAAGTLGYAKSKFSIHSLSPRKNVQ